MTEETSDTKTTPAPVVHDRSCERHKRCSMDPCEVAACESYKYAYKRYRKVDKTVLLPLSKAEVLDVVELLIAAAEDKAREKANHSELTKTHKAEIERLENDISDYLRRLKKKAREEECLCEEEYNDVTGLVTTHIVKENGKLGKKIEERNLTDNEKQAEMQLVAETEILEANAAVAQGAAADDDQPPDIEPDEAEDDEERED